MGAIKFGDSITRLHELAKAIGLVINEVDTVNSTSLDLAHAIMVHEKFLYKQNFRNFRKEVEMVTLERMDYSVFGWLSNGDGAPLEEQYLSDGEAVYIRVSVIVHDLDSCDPIDIKRDVWKLADLLTGYGRMIFVNQH